MIMEKLPWVEKNAEVVMYFCGRGNPSAVKTVIERVNKLTFSVRDSTRRFDLNHGYSQEGGSWSAGYRVVPADSDEARKQLAEVEDWKKRRRVHNSYDRWVKNPTLAYRQALIDALNAIENDEE